MNLIGIAKITPLTTLNAPDDYEKDQCFMHITYSFIKKQELAFHCIIGFEIKDCFFYQKIH